jgi:hypothetical protein
VVIEDFSTYTEVDPNNKLSVTSSTVSATWINEGDTAYVRDSKGAGHFKDFAHLFEAYMNDQGAGYFYFCPWAISNGSSTWSAMGTADEGIAVYNQSFNSVYCRWACQDFTNDNSDYGNLQTLDTLYYAKVERNGTTFTVAIYSDSGRTSLVDTLTITCAAASSASYEYVHGWANAGSGADVNSAYSQNLDLQEAASPTTTFNLNSILRKRNLKTYNLNSILKQINSSDYNLNSILKTVNTEDFNINSILEQLQTQIFNLNSILKATETKTYNINSILLKVGNLLTYRLNAILKEIQSGDYNLNSIIYGIQTTTYNINAILGEGATFTTTFNINAYLYLLGRTSIQTATSNTSIKGNMPDISIFEEQIPNITIEGDI